MNRELSPGAIASIVGGLVILVFVIALAAYNPFKRIPDPPKNRISSGAPIPPPPSPDMIRHGPIGP